MIRSCCLSLLVWLATILVSPAPVSADPCEERSIAAGAVRTREDVRAFVQCAYEFVREAGFAEARRAFNEDERWKSGPTYVFVNEITDVPGASRAFVYPPDPSREGVPWGPLVDDFGTDLALEFVRVANDFGEGWVYYSFANPATGRAEPKASYFKSIEWNGVPVAIGAGVYRRDLPGSCEPEEVNAGLLESDPSNERLQEFVRCAAMELEANGYFGIRALTSAPRWRNQSIYLFGLDTNGSPLFSGNPDSRSWWGGHTLELTDHMDGPFEGRDVVSVGDAFGETFLYYSTRNPWTGTMQGKVAFVKRGVVSGLPILIGSGYYGEPTPESVDRPDGTAPAPSQAGGVVVAGTDATFGNDDYVLNSATITGDTLTVSVSYSGGCRAHVFTLVIAASFVDSSPVRLPAELRHDANGDPCEAFPTESYAFDLALVRARYQEVYGPGAGRVAIEIDGGPDDGLVYEFTE